MPPPLASVGPGDPLPYSREAVNAMIQAGRNALVPLRGADAPRYSATPSAPALVILVRNDTGAELPAFAVVKLGTPLIDPAVSPHGARLTPCFSGGVPGSYLDPFAVLIAPAATGAVARAVILGPVPVQVTINNAGDGWAAPDATTGTGGLLSQTDGGPAKIVYASGTTGTVTAIVLLQGDMGAGGGGPGPVGPVGPPGLWGEDGEDGLFVQVTVPGADPPVLAKITASSGTPPVHTATRQTRTTGNAVTAYSPTTNYTQVLNPNATALPDGTCVELYPILDWPGWWWADPCNDPFALTVQDASGTPSYSPVSTIQVGTATGLLLSQPAAGTAKVAFDLAVASYTTETLVTAAVLSLSGLTVTLTETYYTFTNSFNAAGVQIGRAVTGPGTTASYVTLPAYPAYTAACGILLTGSAFSFDYEQVAGDAADTGLVEVAGEEGECPTLGIDLTAAYTTTEALDTNVTFGVNNSAVLGVTQAKTTFTNSFNAAGVQIGRASVAPVLTSTTVSVLGDSTWIAVTGNAGAGTLQIGHAGPNTVGLTTVNNPTQIVYDAKGHVTGVTGAAAPTYGPPPAQPTSLTATPGNAQASLSWTAPTGSPAASSYGVYYSTSATLSSSATLFASGVTGTTETVTGLTNATLYYFFVTAVFNGAASAVASTSATPAGSTTYSTAGTYTFTATATSHLVECWGGGAGGANSGGAAGGGGGGGGAYAKSTVTGLTIGTGYTVVVGAGGAAGGNGGASSFNGTSVVAAGGAKGSASGTGGAGGTTGSSTGSTLYAGGTGGAGVGSSTGGAGQGGSSAGTGAGGTTGAAGSGTTGGSGATAPTGGGNGGAGGGSGAAGTAGGSPGGGGGAGGGSSGAGAAGSAGQVRIT